VLKTIIDIATLHQLFHREVVPTLEQEDTILVVNMMCHIHLIQSLD